MAIRLKNLLKLPSLSKIELLSGEKGLDNIVTWPYACQMNSFSEWVQGGELVFITGFGINDNEDIMVSFVQEGHKCKIAGLVFFADKYIKRIPQKLLDLSNKLNLPVFKLPWEVKLIDITREISGFIVSSQKRCEFLYNWAENILFGNEKSLRDAEENSKQFGFDVGIPHQIAIISDDFESDALKTAVSEKHLNYFFVTVQDVLQTYSSDVLCIPHGNYLILIIPAKNNKEEDAENLLNNVYGELLSRNSELKFYAGIGRICTGSKGLRKSYIDAERVIRLVSVSKVSRNILSYRNLGIFRIFYEVSDRNELLEFYNDIMGPLLKYDKQNNTEFVKTLDILFENKMNHIKTAQSLYIHRNSLVYRLNRIEKILNLKLDDPTTLLELQTCILIGRFLDI